MKINLSGLVKQARLQIAVDIVESIMKSVDVYETPSDMKMALAELGLELVSNEKEVTLKYEIPLISFDEDFEVEIADENVLSSFEEVKSSYVEIDGMVDQILDELKEEIEGMSEEELSQDGE